MTCVLTGLVVLLLVPPAANRFRPQDSRSASQPQNQFFSGTVVAVTKEKVTVVRAVAGKNSETRTFSIDASTRVEGSLRVKARVTVRYVDDRAIHIIVRPAKK